MALTAKQDAFARVVASGKSQADAYRVAYDASKMSAQVIQNKASLLMKKGEVTVRVAELRKPVIVAAQITLASHLDRLAALSDAAEQSSQYSAAIAAEVARGKASGLYVDKTELTGSGGAPLSIAITFE